MLNYSLQNLCLQWLGIIKVCKSYGSRNILDLIETFRVSVTTKMSSSKKVNHVNHQLYEVEPAEAEVEHKEPVGVGFFILHNAKLRMLEL